MSNPKKEEQAQQTPKSNIEWAENRQEALNFLKNIKVKKSTDRLEILRDWVITHNILQGSLVGWAQWLSNIHLIEQLDRNLIKDLFQTYKEFTEAFLEFDIEATKAVEENLPKEEQTKQKPDYAV